MFEPQLKLMITVQGPEPVIDAGNGPADAQVSFWITTYPGRVEFVACGADQPAGTTSLNWPVAALAAVALTVNALLVLPATAVVGEIVIFNGDCGGGFAANTVAAAMTNASTATSPTADPPSSRYLPARVVDRGVVLIPFPLSAVLPGRRPPPQSCAIRLPRRGNPCV